jgi:hypothetical protein
MPAFAVASRSRTTLPGIPITSDPSGISLPSAISAPAPIRHPLPITRTVQHRRPHADQRAVADGAAMQHRLVPDGAIRADRQRIAHVGMEHAVLLHVRARADTDLLVVAAQRRAEPDRGARLQHHAADQVGVRRDPGIGGDLGGDAVRARRSCRVPSSNSSARRRTWAARPGCCGRFRRSAVTMVRSRSVASRSSLTRT